MNNKNHPPICRECIHYEYFSMAPNSSCCKKVKNIVTGGAMSCYGVRANENQCGVSGKWYEAKNTEEKTKEISFWKKILKGER